MAGLFWLIALPCYLRWGHMNYLLWLLPLLWEHVYMNYLPLYSVSVTRVRGSNASTSAVHLADQSWGRVLSQVYLLVLLNVLICSVFALLHPAQNPSLVSCVLAVSVLLCALVVPQASLFVWRVVVAVD